MTYSVVPTNQPNMGYGAAFSVTPNTVASATKGLTNPLMDARNFQATGPLLAQVAKSAASNWSNTPATSIQTFSIPTDRDTKEYKATPRDTTTEGSVVVGGNTENPNTKSSVMPWVIAGGLAVCGAVYFMSRK